MIIARKVSCCDFTDKRYDTPVMGVAFLAQGATGRWCEVMWCGPEYAQEKGYVPISREEAVAQIEKLGGWADF